MKKTRIVQIAGMRYRAGIENFIMNVLSSMNIETIQFDFIYTWEEEGPYDQDIKRLGCNIINVTPYGKSFVKIIKHFKELYNYFKENQDISAVHIHGNTATGCLDAIIARISGVKRVIVHSHNSGVNGMRNKVLHSISKVLIAPFITERFACSKQAWNWMFFNRKNKIGVDKIVFNGIDAKKYIYDEEMAFKQKQLFNFNDSIIIGFVGRLTEQKNPLFLIEILSEFLKIEPNSKMLVVGDGELFDDVKKSVIQNGLKDNVILAGSRSNVNELFQAMDIFVLPSLWEGLGIVLIEAQAAGIRCVVSDVIAEEVYITDLVKTLSIKKSAKDWAVEIHNTYKASKKENQYERVVEAGYDIENTANWLHDFYLETNR